MSTFPNYDLSGNLRAPPGGRKTLKWTPTTGGATSSSQNVIPATHLHQYLEEGAEGTQNIQLSHTTRDNLRIEDRIRPWTLYCVKDGRPCPAFYPPTPVAELNLTRTAVMAPQLSLTIQSVYILGKDHMICDIPVDHPSCSGQHAVLFHALAQRKKKIQSSFRSGARKRLREDGEGEEEVVEEETVVDAAFYLMDLGSTNGTFLNGSRIEPFKKVQLCSRDMIVLGKSTRTFIADVE